MQFLKTLLRTESARKEAAEEARIVAQHMVESSSYVQDSVVTHQEREAAKAMDKPGTYAYFR